MADKIELLAFKKKNCGPCKLMEPVVASIEQENPDIEVHRIDIDENPLHAVRYTVMAAPTFVILKGGQIRNVIAGRVPAAKLRAAVEAVK